MSGLDGELAATSQQQNFATLSCWRSLVKVHAIISREIQTDLIERRRLTLGAFEVLVQLSGAPVREQRMTDLAEAVLLSRSGLTRLIDRLERMGLVIRHRAPDDGRGVAVQLTEFGLEYLLQTSETHTRSVKEHFGCKLDPAEMVELDRILGRLADLPFDRDAVLNIRYGRRSEDA